MSFELQEAKTRAEPPSYLQGEAKEFWKRTIKHTDVSEADRDTFALVCQLWAAIQQCDPQDKQYSGLVLRFSSMAKEFDLFPGTRKQRKISELGVSHRLTPDSQIDFSDKYALPSEDN